MKRKTERAARWTVEAERTTGLGELQSVFRPYARDDRERAAETALRLYFEELPDGEPAPPDVAETVGGATRTARRHPVSGGMTGAGKYQPVTMWDARRWQREAFGAKRIEMFPSLAEEAGSVARMRAARKNRNACMRAARLFDAATQAWMDAATSAYGGE